MKYILFLVIFLSCRTGNNKVIPDHLTRDTDVDVYNNSDTTDTNKYDPLRGKDSVILQKIMDSIYKFPRVQAIDKQISRNSNGIHGVSFMVDNEFNGDTSYYYIAIGDNSRADRYVNIYNFLVSKKSFDIKVYDTAIDSIINLQAWRSDKD